ncbi:MAG: hypothetical protein AAF570_29255, partial [Bacteroidota bacterium]
DALIGNLTFVLATLPSNPEIGGVGSIMVSPCDCGNGNPDVDQIQISNPTMNLSVSTNPLGQVNATAVDAGGNTVSSPALRYCSDDIAVVNVDELTGEVFAMGPGTGTIRVCSGNYAEATLTVNVSF